MKVAHLALLGLITVEQINAVKLNKDCYVCQAKHTDHKIMDALAQTGKDPYDIPDSEIWSDNIQLKVEGELANKHNQVHHIMDATIDDKPRDYYDVKDNEIWPEQVQLSVEGSLASQHDTRHHILDQFSEKPNDYYDVKDTDVWPDQVQLSVEGGLSNQNLHAHKILDAMNDKVNGYYDDVALQMRDDPPAIDTKWTKDKQHPGFPAWMDEYEGWEGLGNYERKIPEHFDGPAKGNHQFMWSMLKKYATEQATQVKKLGDVGGIPTGNFVLKKPDAMAAAKEVVGTHMNLHGKEADDYLAAHFENTWNHFDNKPDGYVDATRMSQFMRMLCGNVTVDLDLQVKADNLLQKKSKK